MKKIKSAIYAWMLAAGSLAISVPAVHAQNTGFNYGDLIVGFQTYGSGTGTYVLANLGSAATLRDSTSNVLNIINVNTALNSAFGSGWANRTDLYMGVATVRENDEFGPLAGLQDGDPYNTVYIGRSRSAVGVEGVAQSSVGSLSLSALQGLSTSVYGAASIFETVGTGAVSTITSTSTNANWDKQNPIPAGVQGIGFDTFSGGVQSVFGAGTFGSLAGITAEAAVDVFRMQYVNNEVGQFGFGAPTGVGTFEGTVLIDGSGSLSFASVAVPEPSTYAQAAVALVIAAYFFARKRRKSNA